MAGKPVWPPVVNTRGGMDVIRVKWAGRQRLYTLGPSGSDESRREYVRILAELEVSRASVLRDGASATVETIVLAFLDRCKAEVDLRQYARIRSALAPLLTLYGHVPATAFGPVGLETVRAQYVRSGKYCRDVCNAMTSIIRQAFKWAASKEMVGEEIYRRLETLGPLLAGKTSAIDHPPIRPVSDDDVVATLPHLPGIVADMVRAQLLLGCRPGEVCLLKAEDIVRPWRSFDGVAVWLYELDRHKTAYKGGVRAIAVGPQAQAVLLPYLEGREPSAYLFSPAEATAVRRSAQRAARKTSVQPSQVDRSKDRPRKTPGTRYTTDSYAGAIERAAKRAGVTHWAPNQLRHSAGTRIEADHGREAAQSVLGHSTPTTTAIYAEISERAGRIAAKDG